MSIISGLMTYFSHSNYGQHQLKAELEKEKNKQGIQAGGATRFSTFSTHAKSIARCFNAIERCLISGTIKFNTKAVSCPCYRKVDTNRLKQTAPLRKYIETGPESFTFQIQLHHINLLLTPMDWGLQTLEGQNTTCSDVFSIFIGIAIGFTHVFQDPSAFIVFNFLTIFIYILDDSDSEIYAYHSETYGVFNRCFAIFLDDCTPDMFLLAYLLDPSEWAMTCQSIISSQHSLLPRQSFEAGTATLFNVFKALGFTPCSSAHRVCTSNASV